MAKLKEMFDLAKDAAAGLGEAAKDMGGKMWDTVAPMANHGKSEVAAALFTGNAYVMYQKDPKSLESEGQAKDAPEMDKDNEREM